MFKFDHEIKNTSVNRMLVGAHSRVVGPRGEKISDKKKCKKRKKINARK